ncbi:hypothetical protein [Brytella acorum]|uniref:Uncharacterized protein n=1 Tax=Brytella acorum TaxID=2959299 RepID=A0AA35VEE0_9PROT|nr:hypothetical protein [Brytella acorum]MDF3625733.1 hypothetical protein [Brytella acorum]CAI9121676.1 hypothetical protein LMG32879_002525 [Brytella acorum]
MMMMNYYLTLPELLSFNKSKIYIKFDSDTIKIIGGLFIFYATIAITIAFIRNNTRSQPIETSIIFFSLAWAAFFIVFSTPLTFFWAHIHGYHLDHYEAARRGGWYVFRLNGT